MGDRTLAIGAAVRFTSHITTVPFLLNLLRFGILSILSGSCWREGGREGGNVLFNDALNTFYLRLYGVRHMVKDHSDIERRNPLPSLHALLFSISSKGFYMHYPTYRIAHTTAFRYTSRGALAGIVLEVARK